MKTGYIAVIAGTTESRNIIEQLQKQEKEIAAFVATTLGREMLSDYPIEIIEGRKNKEQFLRFFKAFRPSKVYDASHPFADIVTQNVKEICERLEIPYERVERQQIEYDYERILYVDDIKEAIAELKMVKGPILLTTGVKTAREYLQGLPEKEIFIRVLQRGTSVETCLQSGYDKDHVFGEEPPFTVEDNERLIRDTKAAVLVTKDSGVQGGVPEKVEAAKRMQIPVIMIRRPEQQIFPRVLIAAVGSGSGKTTITLGIMQALKERGLLVQGYKCGPDYIDPMYHTRLTKRPSINVDPFFHKGQMDQLVLNYATGADIGILEGVMGFYDGQRSTTTASTFEVAQETKTPVILVLSVKGMANTVIPMIQGVLQYRENTIKAVILNQCSKGYYMQIKPRIEEECHIKVVGYLPEKKELRLSSRHLGLCMANEMENWKHYIQILAQQVQETLDLDTIIKIGRQASVLNDFSPTAKKQYPISMAVARDEAFCFYYEDNLQMLKQRGVTLKPFSPLTDQHLPKDIQAIYLGGGYPELFAGLLENNQSIRAEIKQWCQMGKPIIAECGGYMYLGESLEDKDGYEYQMCQAFSHKTKMSDRLNMHFGYVTVKAKTAKDCLFEEPVKAHEFHYSTESGDDFSCIVDKSSIRSWESGYVNQSQYAAYPHLSFRGNEAFLERFLERAKEEL